MKDISKNKKILYAIIAVIIILGIIITATLKLNFSLVYSDSTRIKIYLGKDYNMEDIKKISEEVFGTKNIVYQEIEVFGEAISITVKDVNEEKIENLKTKLKEKYEVENLDGLVQMNQIAHLRLRDIVRPYIIPITIATIIILAYVGIRYMKIGVVKSILTLLLRMIIFEGIYLSVIAIARIPVSAFLMPVAIGIYLVVITFTIKEFQEKVENLKIEENNK